MADIVWLRRGDYRKSQGVFYCLRAPHENPFEAANRHISENPADRDAALAVVYEDCDG